jgi:menaquinone-dependent protoporphyrinogen oxidase
MKVLVSAASKHGATGEIAAAVGTTLGARGLEVTVTRPEDVAGVAGYDGYVIGSAVYAGHWLKPATELAGRVASDGDGQPLWMFSSGPLGDPPQPEGEPPQVTELAAAVGAREHRMFAGRLDKALLSRMERAVVKMVRAPEGDDRDFAEISRWADGIADVLLGSAASEDRPVVVGH